VSVRILIVGGYGTFGARLARLLAGDARLTLIVAGRSLARAEALCAGLPAGTRALPLVFDREGDVEGRLAEAAPDLVVDAAGPFQLYGEDPYRLVRACIARKIHYVDLADGADFVAGVDRFRAEAREAGVFVLAGASTFPALSAAAVRHLVPDGARIGAVRAGVAPSPWSGVGLNVVRAIASYAGKPVAPARQGDRPGWAIIDSRRRTIAVPGGLPLANIRFTLAETPDLRLAGRMWGPVRQVWTGAGPTPELLHRLLSGFAWLVRLGLVRSLAPLAGFFHWGSRVFRWGERRGGMFVEIDAEPAGGAVTRAWHLVAEGDDGPFIPSIGAAAIVRRMLAGQAPEPGARAAYRDLELADYQPFFDRLAIAHGRWEQPPEGAPLYRRILGEAWERLPPPVRAMHDLKGARTVRGEAEVERGRGPLAALTALVMGLPKAGSNVPVEVTFEQRNGGELWTRRFAGKRFSSFQEEGRGRSERLVVERFGPVAVGMAVVLDGERLRLVIRRATLFGVPLPAFLRPSAGETCERADEHGRFRFEVEIRAPLAGLVVRYRGWLA